MEEPVKSWGGKRREGINQTPKTIKISNDLLARLGKIKNFNRFVNEAIEEKLAREAAQQMREFLAALPNEEANQDEINAAMKAPPAATPTP